MAAGFMKNKMLHSLLGGAVFGVGLWGHYRNWWPPVGKHLFLPMAVLGLLWAWAIGQAWIVVPTILFWPFRRLSSSRNIPVHIVDGVVLCIDRPVAAWGMPADRLVLLYETASETEDRIDVEIVVMPRQTLIRAIQVLETGGVPRIVPDMEKLQAAVEDWNRDPDLAGYLREQGMNLPEGEAPLVLDTSSPEYSARLSKAMKYLWPKEKESTSGRTRVRMLAVWWAASAGTGKK